MVRGLQCYRRQARASTDWPCIKCQFFKDLVSASGPLAVCLPESLHSASGFWAGQGPAPAPPQRVPQWGAGGPRLPGAESPHHLSPASIRRCRTSTAENLVQSRKFKQWRIGTIQVCFHYNLYIWL